MIAQRQNLEDLKSREAEHNKALQKQGTVKKKSWDVLPMQQGSKKKDGITSVEVNLIGNNVNSDTVKCLDLLNRFLKNHCSVKVSMNNAPKYHGQGGEIDTVLVFSVEE